MLNIAAKMARLVFSHTVFHAKQARRLDLDRPVGSSIEPRSNVKLIMRSGNQECALTEDLQCEIHFGACAERADRTGARITPRFAGRSPRAARNRGNRLTGPRFVTTVHTGDRADRLS